MASKRGATQRALISRRGDHENSTSCRDIERLFKRLLPLHGRLRDSQTEIDHPYTGVDTVDDRGGKFLGRRARHLFMAGPVLSKNGADQQSTARQIAGATEPRLADNMPATNVPCEQAKLMA